LATTTTWLYCLGLVFILPDILIIKGGAIHHPLKTMMNYSDEELLDILGTHNNNKAAVAKALNMNASTVRSRLNRIAKKYEAMQQPMQQSLSPATVQHLGDTVTDTVNDTVVQQPATVVLSTSETVQQVNATTINFNQTVAEPKDSPQPNATPIWPLWLLGVLIFLLKINTIDTIVNVLEQIFKNHDFTLLLSIVIAFAPLVIFFQQINDAMQHYATAVVLFGFGIESFCNIINIVEGITKDFATALSHATGMSNVVLPTLITAALELLMLNQLQQRHNNEA
jgi:hypothetical protein